ncbi:MAG: hypothetical protein WAL66_15945, partial [Nitrososphaeraceae archaeon]
TRSLKLDIRSFYISYMRLSGVQLANVANSRPKLLLPISIFTLGMLTIPVIMPHITQVNTIYYILLEVGTLITSIFLGVVAIGAFKRNDTTRLLFMSLGCVSLIIIESLFLLFATINIEDIIIHVARIELPLFAMFTLFGIEVFRVSNNKL